MSYQVLARKWRPRNFSTLVGQEHVVRALTHALSEQRLHHAYLFTGTRGVGKTTIARILAKSLNCETGITATPCGKCSSCLEIDAGRFVDLLEVDAATNTRVEEMRQLLENAVYAPTRGRYKVYVIDEVHMLSNSAFNAMLKTLEEPPEHVKFILATTDPQKIPVTVLSRCLQFNLKQMPAALISSHLAQILQAEDVPFDTAGLALIARSASGSMRDSLSLLDQAIAHGAGRVDEAQVRTMLGNVDQDHLFTILEALHEGNASVLLQTASIISVRSLSFSSALQELGALLTRLQIAQCVPSAIDESDPDRDRVVQLAESLSPEFVQLAYQIVNVGRSELASAPDEYAGFVMTLLRLHTFRPLHVSEIVDAGRAVPRATVASPKIDKVLPSSVEAKPIETKPVDLSPVVPVLPEGRGALSDWSQIIAELGLSGFSKELAANCELREMTEALCVLRLPSTLSHLQMKPAPDRLQQALIHYFGRPLVLKIELGSTQVATPAEISGRQREERLASAVEAIEQDVFVQSAIEMLGASVVESSIKPVE